MTATMPAGKSQANLRNGVDVGALQTTVAAIENRAELAAFRFRAANRWLTGDHNRSTIDGLFGACEEHRRRTPFIVDNGEPAVLLGGDRGPNPLEHLLNALLGCLTTSIAYHAAMRGIDVHAMESSAEGELDVRGSLGLGEGLRKAFTALHVRFRIRSAAAVAELEQCARMSPMLELVSASVPVRLEIERV